MLVDLFQLFIWVVVSSNKSFYEITLKSQEKLRYILSQMSTWKFTLYYTWRKRPLGKGIDVYHSILFLYITSLVSLVPLTLYLLSSHPNSLLLCYKTQYCLLWFNCKMFTAGSYVWTLGAQPVRLFWKVVEPLRGRVFLEKCVARCDPWGIRTHSPYTLSPDRIYNVPNQLSLLLLELHCHSWCVLSNCKSK